jgi:hypothetical protein
MFLSLHWTIHSFFSQSLHIFIMKYNPLLLLAIALPCTLAAPANIESRQTTAQCGIAGYSKPNVNAYYFNYSPTQATYAACSALCKSDAPCASFAFGEGYCMLFNVANNANPTPGSPYTFYDKSCLPTTTTTTTAPTATNPPGVTCGVKGYDTAGFSSYYDATPANANFAACSAHCKADINCGCFAFGNGACLHYSFSAYA